MPDATDATGGVRVGIRCDVCGTYTHAPREEAGAATATHNAHLHSGEPVAYIDPGHLGKFSDT